MQAILDLRARYKEKFEKEHGIKLGFTSFFVKAALAAASNADRKNVWESETIPGTFQRRRNYGLVGRVEYAGDWATLTSLTAYCNNLYSLRADSGGESNFPFQDRKSVVSGKRVSVRVELGGSRIINKKILTQNNSNININ